MESFTVPPYIYTVIIFKYLCITCCAVLASATCHAQAPRPLDGEYYIQPKEYPLFPKADSINIRQFISSRFYPIGWSVDGKLAYLEEPADEACGCYFLNLIVYDVPNNKEVYHYYYNDNYIIKDTTKGAEPQPDSMKASTLSAAWYLLSPLFSVKLDSFHINQTSSWTDIGMDFTSDGHKYQLHEKDEKNMGKDDPEVFVRWYAVSMDRDITKEKRTHKATFHGYSGVLQVSMLHTFKHPTGKWIAVIMGLENRGWEGTPHVNSIGITGLAL